MNEAVKNRELKERVDKDYEWGFVSDVEQEFAPKGLSEDTIRFISSNRPLRAASRPAGGVPSAFRWT